LEINFPVFSPTAESECMKILRIRTKGSVSIQPLGSHGFETLANPPAIKSIIFPDPGQIRSRKVVSRSNVRSAGKYPSWKMGRMLHWESSNELNAFRLLDCNPDVTSFTEQPCKVVYVMDGVERVHYPDVLLETTGGKEFWEVKLRSKALDPEVLARAAFLSSALPRWGYVYRTVFGEDLARQPRLNNANLILGFGKRAVTDREWEHLRRVIAQKGSLVWSEACSGNYGAKGRQVLCSLVLRGILSIDMDTPLSPTTQFVARKVL
jgi:hypothetical protein